MTKFWKLFVLMGVGVLVFVSYGAIYFMFNRSEKHASTNIPKQESEEATPGFITWTASSHTAEAITGDVGLSDSAIVLGSRSYPLSLVRQLGGSELSDSMNLLSIESGSSEPEGKLFKTDIPSTAQLLNSNTVCGSENVKWVLTVIERGTPMGRQKVNTLSLAFFSGAEEPILDTASLDRSRNLCGTFSYLSANQNIPRELYGTWTVRRVLPASTISCWGQDQADRLIGTEIEYSADTLRWKDQGAVIPEVEVKTVTADQFMADNSGSQSYVDFKVLGIQANQTTEISLNHPNSKEWEGTSEIPGDNVLIKNPDTIVFSVCNVYFEAERKRR
jgi:hypothetical protein